MTKISEERGGDEGFAKLAAQVTKAKNIEGVILDIVPNHVAANWRNPAWWDVLKEGRNSKHWSTFDIRARGASDMRVVLPVLGRSRQAILAARELHLGLLNGELVFKYYDNFFPVSSVSYTRILHALVSGLNDDSKRAVKWKKQLTTFAEKASVKTAAAKTAAAFAKWALKDGVASRVIDLTLRTLPLKFVTGALDEQNFALEDWKGGSREVNYRRFFDINDLAAIRVEDETTFRWAHQKIHSLVKKYPIVHGLRVDHVDGLTNPEAYLKRLSKISKNVWVEKILGEGELVPRHWQTRGTTGYEFLGSSARLFVDLPGLLHLHSHYTRKVDRRWERFHDCVYESKREMLDSHFVSELNYITEQFFLIANRGRKSAEFNQDELREALKELTSSLRVYRVYFNAGHASKSHWLVNAFAEVEGRGKLPTKAAFNWLRSILLGKGDWSEPTVKLLHRWEQLTGPVMAKGLEDTALYRYFPLLSLNVVGAELDWSGDGAIEFHAFNQERLRSEPLTMSTTSTHDTKRSEDVRCRISYISEIAEEWTDQFESWHIANMPAAQGPSETRIVPERPIEYMVYETLLGACPLDGVIDQEFADRMKQYFLKAAREGKSETSWTEPDEKYESALMAFVDRILFPKTKQGQKFLKEFKLHAARAAYFGAFNSLSSLTLKVMSPGLPDFYQGSELWDFSLVDPDNRRPVDYGLRRKYLKTMKAELKEDPKSFRNRIVSNWKTGEVKQWLTWELLKLRKADPDLFIKGEYYSLEPRGAGRRHFVSILRRYEERWALVVIPRFLASAIDAGKKLSLTDEMILSVDFPLPMQAPTEWTSALTGKKIDSGSPTAKMLLENLPVGIYLANE